MARELTPAELSELLAAYALDAVDPDERAQIVRYDANYFDPYGEITQDSGISVNRPRTIGLRYGRRF